MSWLLQEIWIKYFGDNLSWAGEEIWTIKVHSKTWGVTKYTGRVG